MATPSGRIGHLRGLRTGHVDHDAASQPVFVGVVAAVFEPSAQHPDWSPAPLPRYFDPCPRHVPIVRSYCPQPRPAPPRAPSPTRLLPGQGPGTPAALAAFRCTRSKDVARQPPEPQRTPACHGFGKRYSRLDWPVPRALQGPMPSTHPRPDPDDSGRTASRRPRCPARPEVVLRQGAAKSLRCLRVG